MKHVHLFAGQEKEYLMAQLYAFRAGTRINAMIQIIARELTDSDIKMLADYFNQLPLFRSKLRAE